MNHGFVACCGILRCICQACPEHGGRTGENMDAEILARQLGDLGRQLEDATVKLAELDVLATGAAIEAARLKEEYEDRLAEGFRDAEGAVEARKTLARLKACPARILAQEASAEAERAKSAVRNQQAAIRTLTARIDIGRSLLSREKTLMAVT